MIKIDLQHAFKKISGWSHNIKEAKITPNIDIGCTATGNCQEMLLSASLEAFLSHVVGSQHRPFRKGSLQAPDLENIKSVQE